MITVSWHLILLIIVLVLLVIGVFTTGKNDFDFRPIMYAMLFIAVLGIYGGIFWW